MTQVWRSCDFTTMTSGQRTIKNNENGNSFHKFTYFNFNQHFGYLMINLFA